jgi:hypothetical protein
MKQNLETASMRNSTDPSSQGYKSFRNKRQRTYYERLNADVSAAIGNQQLFGTKAFKGGDGVTP